jgi:Uma2 family endonuclease
MPFVTPEEYLAAERAASFKSEYVSGQIWAMSGASRRHNAIAVNLVAALHAALRGGPCQVFGSDMRVFVPENVTYAYPDVTVVCGEQQYTDEAVDTLLNPVIIIEILSPSTAHYDRAVKFIKYRRLPSLHEYLLVHQDAPRIERFEKVEDIWTSGECTGLQTALELPSIGVTLSVADLYDRVAFRQDGG